MTKDKIMGMFAGIALGHCIAKNAKLNPEIQKAMPYKNLYQRGLWYPMVDSRFTTVVAQAMMDANGLDMDVQAERHKEALGRITLDDSAGACIGVMAHASLQALIDGKATWKDSGNATNGIHVAAKVAPLGAYAAIDDDHYGEAIHFATKLNHMTHTGKYCNSLALAAVAAYAYAIKHTPEEFDESGFIDEVVAAADIGNNVAYVVAKGVDGEESELGTSLVELHNLGLYKDPMELVDVANFAGRENDFPFALALFLKKQKVHNIRTLFVAFYLTDFDTNICSIIGGLIGALHGLKIFEDFLPKNGNGEFLESEIAIQQEFLKTAEAFADKFGFV